MDKAIDNGTNILLFHRKNGEIVDETNFIEGKIIKNEKIIYNSQHGSDWYDYIYTILGNDGKLYKARYGNTIEGYYIRTFEDHLKNIKKTLKDNMDLINNINTYNNKLEFFIDYLTNKQNDNNKIR